MSSTSHPPHLTHPSHAGCTLSLRQVITYPSGAFTCNACKRYGDGLSYHCKSCSYDLHVSCAMKPVKVKHEAHQCELELTFKKPYAHTDWFTCNVCGLIGSSQWIYRCDSCGFDVHMDCSAAVSDHMSQLTHSARMGSVPSQFHGQPVMGHSHSMPNAMNSAQALGGVVGLGGGFVVAAVKGLIGGAFQQVGQMIMQEIIGGGGDVGGDTG